MTELKIVDAPMTPFDEARAQIDAWEKSDPNAGHIALVLDGEDDILVTVTGAATKASDQAGLLFAAATAVLEQ